VEPSCSYHVILVSGKQLQGVALLVPGNMVEDVGTHEDRTHVLGEIITPTVPTVNKKDTTVGQYPKIRLLEGE
jgi:hypothetical protein